VATTLTLTWSGVEWVATANGAAAGDVELRFRQSAAANSTGLIPVAGSVKGTAIHLPQMIGGVAPYAAQLNFGSDNRTAFAGSITPAKTGTNIHPFAILDADGSGAVIASDGSGRVCPGTSFDLTLFPQTSNQ